MPDWIIHMGAAHVVAQPRRYFDMRWLLLGAVLPDAIPRVAGSTIAVLPFLDWLATASTSVYLGFLHTPVVVGILALGLGQLAVARTLATGNLLFGAATHFALDLLQKTWGGGTSLLFPFDLSGFSLQVVWYDNPWTKALVASSAIYLVGLSARGKLATTERVLARWRPRTHWLAVGLAAVAVGLPIPWVQAGIAANVGGTRLLVAPQEFEGQHVQLPSARVETADEHWVYLEVSNVVFRVQRSTSHGLVPGTQAALRGVYRDGAFELDEVFVYDHGFKRAVSLLGGLLLIVVWLPGLRASPAANSKWPSAASA